MFSKQEAANIRKQFWTSFGKSFPRKWILYNTQIKGCSFKFVANRKEALVCLDIEHVNNAKNKLLFAQLVALKSILQTEYFSNIIFDEDYILENGKSIKRIYIRHTEKFSIYNKNSWKTCFEFYLQNMSKFELFFHEYKDFIKQVV